MGTRFMALPLLELVLQRNISKAKVPIPLILETVPVVKKF
jgi:hypothetical protein